MKIEDLNKRWESLKNDAQTLLSDAIESFGGSFYFVEEGDERLDEVDDLSELGAPLIDAYTYRTGKQGSFNVTSVLKGKNGIEFYGVDENYGVDMDEETLLDHVPLAGILDILENLPEKEEK